MKGPRWPKQRSVDWETRPALFECLLRTKLLPKKFIASGKLWDPFYCRGSVAKVYAELGLTVRHQNENFWDVWEKVLEPETFLFTNPPFGKGMAFWLKAFFNFVVTFDRPFLLILPNYICTRSYFGVMFSKILRPHELHIWGLNKSFPMLKVGAKDTTNFTGLTIAAYYPTKWNFVLDKDQFKYVFLKTHIHLK